MKLAFNSATCPGLDLNTLIQKSKDWGYAGFEVPASSRGPELGPPAELRCKLQDAGQQIAALNAGVLVAPTDSRPGGNREQIRETIEQAAEIGCPLVIASGAPLPVGADKLRLLDRTAAVVHGLAAVASRHAVTLAVENAGVCALSVDAWHVRDAAGSPAVRVCLDPLAASDAGEPPSRSINRLAASLAMVRVPLTEPQPPDAGERIVETDVSARNPVFLLELLKGLAYQGWVCVGWPANTSPGADASAEPTLESWAPFLRSELDKPIVELTAYKGDTNTPRFAPRDPVTPSSAAP